MIKKNNTNFIFILLFICLFLLFFVNISLGSVTIPLSEIIKGITGYSLEKETWEIILFNFRLPKAITALLVGTALSISGLLMQTLFRNPLAGPYVLGLSSGASLGVAFLLLGSAFLPHFILSYYSITLVAALGSFLVAIAVLILAERVRNTMAILIVGLMFSSFTSAIVAVLSYFSTAEQLQKFTFWALGSIGNLSWEKIQLLSVLVIIGLAISVATIKPLNALLLGEKYAESIGVNLKKTKYRIIIATCILTGSVTALVGPIAFIGLAVPHISKLIFKTSNHFTLIIGTVVIGSSILLICDSIAQVPNSNLTLPLNAITSIVGAPIVIMLLVRKNK